MRKLVTPAALLSAIALLAACGGGGDDATSTPAAQTPPSNNNPPPAPEPKPAPDPAPAGELLPSLSAPQPGSTAALGNGSEGLWTGSMNATLIDSSGKFMHFASSGVLTGAFQLSGSTWTLNSDPLYEDGYISPATGTGTITQGQRLSGNFVKTSSRTSTVLLNTYDPSNALAVDQAAIAGLWKQSGFAMQIDDAGNLTGTYTSGTRVCDLQGTVKLAEPGSAKNLYTVNVTPADSTQPNSTGCDLSTGVLHKGFAAIRLMPADGGIIVTSSTRFARTLVMAASTGAGGYFTTQMSKQKAR